MVTIIYRKVLTSHGGYGSPLSDPSRSSGEVIVEAEDKDPVVAVEQVLQALEKLEEKRNKK